MPLEEFNFRRNPCQEMIWHRKWSTSAINLILRLPPPSTLRAAPFRVEACSLRTNTNVTIVDNHLYKSIYAKIRWIRRKREPIGSVSPREQRLSTFTVICSCRCACCIAQDGRQLAIADWRWRGGLFDRRLVVPAQAGASNFDRDYTNFIVYAPSRWLKHWVSSHEQQYRTRVLSRAREIEHHFE